jgi:hypothetical protein
VKIVKHLIANRDEARETARLSREYAVTRRNIRDSVASWHRALGTKPAQPSLAALFKEAA